MVLLYKILSIILLTSNLLCFLKFKKSKLIFSPIFGLLIGVIYFIIFPLTLLTFAEEFTLNPLSGATGNWTKVNLNDPAYIFPYLVIWSTLFLSSLIILFFPFKTKVDFSCIFNNKLYARVKFVLIFSVILQTVDWFILFNEFGGVSNYLNNHWYMRNDFLYRTHGEVYVLLSKIFHSNKLILTGTSTLYTLMFLSNKIKNKGFSLLLLIILTFHFLIILLSGNRIYFAIYFILCFFGFLVFNYKKPIYLSTIIVPILVFVFSAWSYTRSSLTNFNEALKSYLEGMNNLNNNLLSMLFDISEGSNIMVALHILKDYGNKYIFLEGSTYLKVISPFFPDFIERVDSFTVITGRNYMPGTNVSLNSTIIGELFANFGLFTILLFPTTILFFLLISLKVNLFLNPIFSFVSCAISCWLVRSVFSDNFLALIISVSLITIELLIYKFLLDISHKKSIDVKFNY